MATVFQDGFDKYEPAGLNQLSNYTAGYITFPSSQTYTALGPLLTAGEWTGYGFSYLSGGSVVGYMAITAGLSSYGTALLMMGGSTGTGNSTSLWRSLGSNITTICGSIWFNANLQSRFGITYTDGTGAQFSIVINSSTGTISLLSGGLTSSTVIATSATSVSANTTNVLDWQITVGASASYAVYLNGIVTPILTGSTGNTRAGTTNNYVNGIQLGIVGASSTGAVTWDNLWTGDTTGSKNNAPLLDNSIIVTQYPNGDYQTQFSNGAMLLGSAYSASPNTDAPGANYLFLRKYSVPVNCTINTVSTVPQATSSVAQFRPVIYSDNAGAPGTLLSAGAVLTGCTTGATLTGTLTTPQSLTASTNYWIGFQTDTSIALRLNDATTTGYKVASTFSSGAPSSPTGFTSGQKSWQIWGSCNTAPVNWATQIDNPTLGGLTYAYGSTVGTKDLYTFPPLPFNPAAIHSISLKSYGSRSDTGTRTIALHTQSGPADGTGTNATLNPTPSCLWLTSEFVTDPNTGLPWTTSGVNSAYHGYAIAA